MIDRATPVPVPVPFLFPDARCYSLTPHAEVAANCGSLSESLGRRGARS